MDNDAKKEAAVEAYLARCYEADKQDIHDVEFIASMLKEANEWGLAAEVVWSAIRAAKQVPALTPSAAMSFGMAEWVK